MSTQSKAIFPHRLNSNGYHDSISTCCHLTVASARNEADLALYEQDHACSPIRLYQLQEDASSVRAHTY